MQAVIPDGSTDSTKLTEPVSDPALVSTHPVQSEMSDVIVAWKLPLGKLPHKTQGSQQHDVSLPVLRFAFPLLFRLPLPVTELRGVFPSVNHSSRGDQGRRGIASIISSSPTGSRRS
jgi:hypothetical protein